MDHTYLHQMCWCHLHLVETGLDKVGLLCSVEFRPVLLGGISSSPTWWNFVQPCMLGLMSHLNKVDFMLAVLNTNILSSAGAVLSGRY